MSMMAETYMLQALQAGLSTIRSNTALLDDILTALNPNELASAKTWFGNAQNKIIIAPGFPMKPEQLPFIGVTVAEESQIPEQTPIGLEYDIEVINGVTTELRGARFVGNLKATIYTPNADLVIWISAVCKWALFSQFDWFASDIGGGFNNLQVRMGDYEPQPEFLPIFTFARGLFLSGEYDVIFTATPSLITSTSTTGTFNIYEQS